MTMSTRQLTISALAFVPLTYAVLFGSRETMRLFAGREQVLETFGAAFFLATSILLLMAYRRLGPQATGAGRWRRLGLLALGFLFFVAAGEELSWGQHHLGFATPEPLRELNAQQEVNLHNLWLLDSYDASSGDKKAGWRSLLLNSNRLFDYFMVGLFWILPFAHGRIPLARGLIDRFGLPVLPWSLGLGLAANWLATAVAELVLVDDMLEHLAVSEIRECNYAFLCLLGAVVLWRRAKGPEPGDGRGRAAV
ncbi:MAG: hypothetical protein AAGD06_01035 [Acidobacteriota bacterium]